MIAGIVEKLLNGHATEFPVPLLSREGVQFRVLAPPLKKASH